MLTVTSTGTLAAIVLASVVLQFIAPASAFVAITSGFVLVCGGTLLMTRLSHTPGALRILRRTLRELRTARDAGTPNDEALHWFLRAASFFRYGNIRPAEDAARRIARPVLRRGAQLVLDGFQRAPLTMALQRQIAEERARLVAPVELLRAMSGYAPTLGMLGTLLGLLQMLFGVSTSDIGSMGAAMGFAMITTVYGLVLSNLLLKPLAAKLEQGNRERFTQSLVDLQAVLLLHDRHHPEYIRDMILDRAQRPVQTRLGAAAGAAA